MHFAIELHNFHSHTQNIMFLRRTLSFDRVFRVCIGSVCALAALDMTTIVIRVNDNSMRGYLQGDYVIGLKHISAEEGDVAVIIDPFENREKIRRVVATESKFMYNTNTNHNQQQHRRGQRRGRNILVPAAHWWCESDLMDRDTGALDSYAVHKRMIEAKVMLKIPAEALTLTHWLNK